MGHRRVFPLLFAVMLQTVLAQCQRLSVQTENGKQITLARTDLEALLLDEKRMARWVRQVTTLKSANVR